MSKTNEPVATGKPSSVKVESDKFEAALLMANVFHSKENISISELITKHYPNPKMKAKS